MSIFVLMKSLRILFCFYLFHIAVASSQVPDVVKSVTLDSIVIVAVRTGGFNVEDFINIVRKDTTFYKSFKNLRYYGYNANADMTIFDKKGQTEAKLIRTATQQVKNGKRWMVISKDKVTGRMYDRKGEFRYMTAEMLDYIFFPRDTAIASNLIGSPESIAGSGGRIHKYYDRLKLLMFNPGAELSGVPLIGNRFAIFDEELRPYYDYKIGAERYRNEVDCFTFTCNVKEELSESAAGHTVIRQLTTYFDRKTFEVVARNYRLLYSSIVFDFDVTMDVRLKPWNDTVVPEKVYYKGTWDIPFKSRERVEFSIRFADYHE